MHRPFTRGEKKDYRSVLLVSLSYLFFHHFIHKPLCVRGLSTCTRVQKCLQPEQNWGGRMLLNELDR